MATQKTKKRRIPNGILPIREWLGENGLAELLKTMEKYPERFVHLFQDRTRRTEKTSKHRKHGIRKKGGDKDGS